MHNQSIIYILSDSIGDTGERVIRAAISQFGAANFTLRRFPYVTSEDILLQILEDAKAEADIVAYTLVLPDLIEKLEQYAEHARFQTVDIMGPIVNLLKEQTGYVPRYEPGLIHAMNEAYFREVEAIEFAVRYDDGKEPRGLLTADLVLIGVSRTSKTPLSMYLAHKRYHVANIPIVPEVDPPEELFLIDPKKVIGLTIKPEVLVDIRTERLKALGLGAKASYATEKRILVELEYADKLMKKIGCHVLDVTHKAVEETASKVIQLIHKR